MSEKIELTEEQAKKIYCVFCSDYLQCCMNKKIGCNVVNSAIEIWRVNGHVIIIPNPVERAKELFYRDLYLYGIGKNGVEYTHYYRDEKVIDIFKKAIQYLEKQLENK